MPLNDTQEAYKALDEAEIPIDVTEWIKGLNKGKVETIITSEGSRYSFNNKDGRHYLEYIDSSRREPNGRFKRVYKGKIEGHHVSYKNVTSSLECLAEYTRWCRTPYARKGRGETDGLTGKSDRRDELLVYPDETSDAKTVYVH